MSHISMHQIITWFWPCRPTIIWQTGSVVILSGPCPVGSTAHVARLANKNIRHPNNQASSWHQRGCLLKMMERVAKMQTCIIVQKWGDFNDTDPDARITPNQIDTHCA
ncbi:hypothetical protein PoB_000680800 [Plakobranchus ocellatus]|uniref:Uncharacterized protein n=1 Tax=Plakobranchus ocellatus TaxID=259542 RepID=A0AAV3YDS9_9GAST|nr:hypothetical protein PoB_000680800 [Plakobranchus ocellatus]